MKRSILVTGGAGYIGSHAVIALIERGYEVHVIDDLSTGNRQLVHRDANFVEAGIDDAAAVRGLIAQHDIGSVMHFAGSIIVAESMADPLKYYSNNVAASIAFIEAVVGAGVRHFVFSSSAAVYGRPERIPIIEEDRRQPINPYGWSKLIIEQALEDVSRIAPINVGALRYFNVAGADPEGRTGQVSKLSTHLIKIGVEAAVGKREKVEIFGSDYATPDGTAVRDYVHVSDLAAAHVLALEWLHDHPEENLVLNCGYGKGYSVAEVLNAVSARAEKAIVTTRSARRAGDPDSLVASNDKIGRVLGWVPAYASLKRMIDDALAWERRI